MDPNNPPITPKNNVLKFFPSEIVRVVEIGGFATTFKRSVAGLRLVC